VKKPRLNVKLLDKVLKHVSAKPERFDMGSWVHWSSYAPCGTAACIAGWTVILAAGNTKKNRREFVEKADELRGGADRNFFFKKARKILGLTFQEAKSLFLTYTVQSGEDAVDMARAKVALLKVDRNEFVRQYQVQ
jgi:hypothetical protein